MLVLVMMILTVALHTDELAELLPLGLEQVHPARLGVVHLVPGEYSDIVWPALLSCVLTHLTLELNFSGCASLASWNWRAIWASTPREK